MQQKTINTRKIRKHYNRILTSGMDFNFLFLLLFLMGFGLMMIYSASSYVAVRNGYSESYFFKKQLFADGLGLVGMIFLTYIPYTFWRKYSAIGYIISLVLVVLVIPFGSSSHGASRWISIKAIGLNLQPAEVAKLFMIIFLAAFVGQLGERVNERKGLITLFGSVVPICLEIYVITRNLSSALIIMMIAFCMAFVASRDYKFFVISGLAVCALAAIIVAVVINTDLSSTGSFRMARIAAWIHPEASSDTTARQTIQGLYAIGNGGLWGQGLGQSVQKISKVPEPHNDMIFTIICEELGLIGAAALIFMYIMLLWKMYTIAKKTRNRFGFMIVVGVMSHIAIQAVLNIAVATNSIPNTGVSLPFISYGGSSVLFLLAEIGLVLSVNRQNALEEANE